jgi:hypothetical protein
MDLFVLWICVAVIRFGCRSGHLFPLSKKSRQSLAGEQRLVLVKSCEETVQQSNMLPSE